MLKEETPRPVFGQPGWRRRMESRYGWDKEFLAVGVVLVVIMLMLSVTFLHADDSTGLSDPKEIMDQQAPAACQNDITFLPLPRWASARMPPLPGQLSPMGKPSNRAKPSPAAVAETKPDMPPMPKKLPQVYPLASSKDPAPAASNSPELIAVSPFLEWIKEHPQEAAAQAHKEAASYAAPPALVNGAPGFAPGAGADPYWMPPMIDTSSTTTSNEAGGSAAIYSTPQK